MPVAHYIQEDDDQDVVLGKQEEEAQNAAVELGAPAEASLKPLDENQR